MLSKILRASIFGLLVAGAAAWSKDVHNQIGFAAEHFLEPYTRAVLSRILEPQYNGSIGRAASWADDYAWTAEGAFSFQWHWIDSADNVRDCIRWRLGRLEVKALAAAGLLQPLLQP